jgi:YNFM family putative membrane transporter
VLVALANAAADGAFLPVLPSIRDELSLDGTQVGALLGATTVVTLLLTLPAGQLAGRLGCRRLLVVAAALGPAALGLMALAPSFEGVLAGRLVFGVAFALTWAITPALAATRAEGARGTGIVLAAAGLGWLAGPVGAGLLASVWGWRVALGSVALVSLPVIVALLRARDLSARRTSSPTSLRATFALLAHSPFVAWAAGVSAILGAVTGVTGVLVPSILADNGVTAAGIGVLIAASSVIWTAAALWSGRLGAASIGLRLAGLVVAGLAACLALPVLSLSTAAVAGFLVLAALCRALLGALLYPLATRAVDGEVGAASLAGVLNLAWAIAALVAPVAAGLALERGVERGVFAVACVLVAVAAVGMLGTARRPATA